MLSPYISQGSLESFLTGDRSKWGGLVWIFIFYAQGLVHRLSSCFPFIKGPRESQDTRHGVISSIIQCVPLSNIFLWDTVLRVLLKYVKELLGSSNITWTMHLFLLELMRKHNLKVGPKQKAIDKITVLSLPKNASQRVLLEHKKIW